MASELTSNLPRISLQEDKLVALQTLYEVSYRAIFDSRGITPLADVKMAHAALSCISSFAGSLPVAKRLRDQLTLATDVTLQLHLVDFQHIILQILSTLRDSKIFQFLELTAQQAEGATPKNAKRRIVTYLRGDPKTLLDLTCLGLAVIPRKVLFCLAVAELNLSDNNLTCLRCEGLPTLITLVALRCHRMVAIVLAHLPSLKSVHVASCNHFITLTHDASSPHLQSVNLSDNTHLTEVPEDTWKMPRRCLIDLSSCSIHPTDVQHAHRRIQSVDYQGPYINMQNQQLATIEKDLFHNLEESSFLHDLECILNLDTIRICVAHHLPLSDQQLIRFILASDHFEEVARRNRNLSPTKPLPSVVLQKENLLELEAFLEKVRAVIQLLPQARLHALRQQVLEGLACSDTPEQVTAKRRPVPTILRSLLT